MAICNKIPTPSPTLTATPGTTVSNVTTLSPTILPAYITITSITASLLDTTKPKTKLKRSLPEDYYYTHRILDFATADFKIDSDTFHAIIIHLISK